jgi:hypothetical protein
LLPYDVVQKRSKIRNSSAPPSRLKSFSNLQSITIRKNRELKPLVRVQPDPSNSTFHRFPQITSSRDSLRPTLPESSASRVTSIKQLATRLGPLLLFDIMLAQPTRRQHIVPQHYSTIPSPPSSEHLAYQQLSQQPFATQQQLFDQKLLNDYLESQQQPYNTSINASNSYMSAYTDFANPAIRVQQSTPTPQPSSNGYQSSMLSNGWNTYGNVQNQSLQTPVQNQNRGHQRASSSSSVGSSASQYQSAPAASYQYVAPTGTARPFYMPRTLADISSIGHSRITYPPLHIHLLKTRS